MKRKNALTIGLLAVVASAAAATSSQATVPGKNGLIVFERPLGGYTHLFTIRPDGSSLQQITHGKFGASHAAWAPDGKTVVMEQEGVATLDLSSGKLRHLERRAAVYPAFSPDGKWIVFAQSTVAHNEGLWIMGANGRQRRYVVNGDGCHHTVFSPAGTQLACLRKGALFVFNVDGSGVRTPLVRPSFGAEGKIDWSPDGSRIAFSNNQRFFTISPDGTGRTRLTGRGSICFESFSPDGAQILAVGNCGGSEASSYLLTMNADGSGVTRIPNTKGAHWASWGRQP